jgi:hypothetical protein
VNKILKRPNLWFALLLLLANGAAWAHALSPQGPGVAVEPRLEPDLATLRERLIEGGHSGEPFRVEVTDQEAAETIAWYLERHPSIPFGEPQVFITPEGIVASGVAQIAGLRVGLTGSAAVELRGGVPYVTLVDLDVAGVAVPGFVRTRIQDEIDAQFALARDLPVQIDEWVLEEGKATVWGTIR